MLTLHVIGDYALQSDFLASQKGKNFFLLFIHAWIWSGILYGGLFFLGLATPVKFLFLLSGHMVIDKIKCMQRDKGKALTIHLYLDQLAHIVQISIVLAH